MRLASVATPDGDRYVAIVDDAESRNFLDSAAVTVRPLHGFSAAQTPVRNVGELLAIPGWREHLNEALIESGDPVVVATSELDTVIPWPGKIICQGLNYAEHILEMGRDLPDYPTLFTKYPEAQPAPMRMSRYLRTKPRNSILKASLPSLSATTLMRSALLRPKIILPATRFLMTTLCGTRNGARPSGTKANLSVPAVVLARG